MKSKIAIDTLNQMIIDGLLPTPDDVIRLNAFGLRIDEARGKRADDSVDLLPRVAILVDPDTKRQIAFRQPTIGHEIWLKSTLRFCARDDYESILALNCFALSRPASALPDSLNPSDVQTAAQAFASSCSSFTRDVLYTAISYARFGIDQAADEKQPEKSINPTTQEEPQPSADSCVAVASLVNGLSVLWGLSLADIKELTFRQLREAVSNAVIAHGLTIGKDAENEAIGAFFAVADEIRSRLNAESKKEKNGQLDHT